MAAHDDLDPIPTAPLPGQKDSVGNATYDAESLSRRWDDPMNLPRRMPFRIDPGISFGQLLTAVPMLITVVWLFSGYARQTDTNQKQLDQYRSDIAAQITGLKSDMTAQMVGMRADQVQQMAQMQLNTDKQFNALGVIIVNLPGMKERVDQLDKRMDQADSRFGAQSNRLEAVQAASIQNSADIINILRVLNVSPQRSK